jgi:competence protein ComEA
MSFYRTLLAVIAAVVITMPVFANDDNATIQIADATQASDNAMPAQSAEKQDSTAEKAKVNLNTATIKELKKVKGLNAAKARAIVAYRKKHGDFKTIDDLKKVKQFRKVSPKNMEEIANQLTIE